MSEENTSSRWASQTEMFANRLRKNHKRLRKWAKRKNISSYRVYDADIPEIPLVVDWYEGRLHIAEYAQRFGRDDDEQNDFLKTMLLCAMDVFDADIEDVFLKRRKKQKGLEQYERFAQANSRFVVDEGGLQFYVNLSDYLDTGLFLDHRPTREVFRKEAKDKRCLNLFSYTGAFTVYAADGGASHITSVDLSNTYLEWAVDNMELNGFVTPNYDFIQEDVFTFLRNPIRKEEERYDLAIIDPPTFSNSKKFAGVFDVQRDHVSLLNRTISLINYGGIVYFSTNSRKFKIEEEAIYGKSIEEITYRSVPEDFRNKRIHRCWRIIV